MEVETPSLLVYHLSPDASAAAKTVAGDIAAQIDALTPVATVGLDIFASNVN